MREFTKIALANAPGLATSYVRRDGCSGRRCTKARAYEANKSLDC